MTHPALPWAPSPPTYCTHCEEPLTRHTGGVCRACGRLVCVDCGEDDREGDWWCHNHRLCEEPTAPACEHCGESADRGVCEACDRHLCDECAQHDPVSGGLFCLDVPKCNTSRPGVPK